LCTFSSSIPHVRTTGGAPSGAGCRRIADTKRTIRLEAGEAGLVRIEARREEARRLQQQRAERARIAVLGVQHREAPEARAHPDRRRGDGKGAAKGGKDLGRQRPGVSRRSGVPLPAVGRRQQGDAVARQHAGGDQGAGVLREPRHALVRRPVMGDQQRQCLGRVRIGGRPHFDRNVRSQCPAVDGQRFGVAGDRRRVEPRRLPVVAQVQHGALAELALGALGIGGIADVLRRAVRPLHLELVFQAVDGGARSVIDHAPPPTRRSARSSPRSERPLVSRTAR
jgi:hypothetical protein